MKLEILGYMVSTFLTAYNATGVPSDPLKLAQFRTMTRLRSACLASGVCQNNDSRIANFNRLLIKAAEHTWGTHFPCYKSNDRFGCENFPPRLVLLAGNSLTRNYRGNWSNENFHAAQNDSNYLNMVYSWMEQRQYLYNAIESLEDHPLANMVNVHLQALI